MVEKIDDLYKKIYQIMEQKYSSIPYNEDFQKTIDKIYKGREDIFNTFFATLTKKQKRRLRKEIESKPFGLLYNYKRKYIIAESIREEKERQEREGTYLLHPRGYTYILRPKNREVNRVKIGQTADPRQRRKQIDSNSPFELEIVLLMEGSNNEKTLHQRFEHLWLHHEWFYLEPELTDYIKSHQEETIRIYNKIFFKQ